MFELPTKTKVNRTLPKEKIYKNINADTNLKKLFVEQVDSILWANKLSGQTLNIGNGEKINEIQVFRLKLKGDELSDRVLQTIIKAIPYKILFLINDRAVIEYNGKLYKGKQDGLKLTGTNLDKIYENFIRQLTPELTDDNIDIAIEKNDKRIELEKQIANLEKKVRSEKQFKKQIELNKSLKKLQEELQWIN